MAPKSKVCEEVKVKECEGFLSTSDRACIRDAEQRLEASKQMQQFSPPPPVHAEAELGQLRKIVAQMKGQSDVAEPTMVERICRRDNVPNCMEKFQEWIAGRQADLNEAMLVERPDEVARISNIMCQAAQQWQREIAVGMFSSMVTNSSS